MHGMQIIAYAAIMLEVTSIALILNAFFNTAKQSDASEMLHRQLLKKLLHCSFYPFVLAPVPATGVGQMVKPKQFWTQTLSKSIESTVDVARE